MKLAAVIALIAPAALLVPAPANHDPIQALWWEGNYDIGIFKDQRHGVSRRGFDAFFKTFGHRDSL